VPATYADRLITITDGSLTIRRYYFPAATSKRIALESIRSAREVGLGTMTGRWRLWGATVPTYWLNLDPSRSHKSTGFVLDVGKRIRPVVTPDNPAAFRAALVANGVQVVESARQLPV
jgi:hypothetical protein